MKDEITVRASDLCVVLHILQLIEDRMVGEQLAIRRLARRMDEERFGFAIEAASKMPPDQVCSRCMFALKAFDDVPDDWHSLTEEDKEEFPVLEIEGREYSMYHRQCCPACGLRYVMTEEDRDAARTRP